MVRRILELAWRALPESWRRHAYGARIVAIGLIGILASLVLAIAGVLLAREGYRNHDAPSLVGGIVIATAFAGAALLSAIVPGRVGISVMVRSGDSGRSHRTKG
jgi:hypothetical protein